MDKRYFPEKLAGWYEHNKRNLPWRSTNDPYRIWLSEVILQQTRVNQGLPYYQSFLKKFPTVAALARTREQDVLRVWQGLGYYTRARNLHKCAKVIVDQHDGVFPRTYDQLLSLPGVGQYTAAAVASFAFGQRVAVVDGNVFRLLSRVFGIDTPINSTLGKKIFGQLADELISTAEPGLHNQAIMEFGATVCVPKNPPCETCIFSKSCVAFEKGLQDLLPVKLTKKKPRKRHFYYLVFKHKNRLLMRRRKNGDIWTGMYDFYLLEKTRPVKPERIIDECQVFSPDRMDAETITKSYKHVLTHQTIISRFIVVRTDNIRFSSVKDHSFFTLRQIEKLPKPALVSRFLDEHCLL